MTELLPYIIVCPLVFLAGFIDAIAGGGGLISLPAYIIAGLPPHLAVGTNKLSSTLGTIVPTIQYARKGYMLPLPALMACILSLSGSWIGAHLALLVTEAFFLAVMIIILPLIACYVFKKRDMDRYEPKKLERRSWWLIAASAFLIGGYDGFYGPGTGTFLMLLLTGLAHLSLQQAAGMTKVVNLSSNVMALTVFLVNGNVLAPLGLAAACFSMLGNYLGARSFLKSGSSIARPAIITVLLIFILKVALELF